LQAVEDDGVWMFLHSSLSYFPEVFHKPLRMLAAMAHSSLNAAKYVSQKWHFYGSQPVAFDY